MLIVGRKYKHYKGGIYTVIATAHHSETLEDVVVYQSIDKKVWVRPFYGPGFGWFAPVTVTDSRLGTAYTKPRYELLPED